MTALTPDFTPGPLAASAAATVALLAPVARFSLRAKDAERAALASALSIELPGQIGRRTTADQLEALCLGPDEWLILTPEVEAARVKAACAAACPDAPHSLTEITDREVTLRVEGPKAAELLTLGCPRDIDRLPAGEARRTILDGATVVLWRDAEQSFRIDLWRSFAPHVVSLLETGCAELAAE